MAKTRTQLRQLIRNKLFSHPEAVTTLSAAITTTTATTLTVTSAANIAERMLLVIESEVLRVVSISGTTITVIRGERGTTAATHSDSTAVVGFPYWGWMDSEINDELDAAVRWLYPEVWIPKFYTNTVNADAKEFGIPSGWSYPDQIGVLKVELKDDNSPALFQEVHFWRHVGDRLIFDRTMDKAREIRLTGKGKQAVLAADGDSLEHDDYAEALVLHAVGRCMETLLANRIRYTEYSASLNDRAADVDQVQRDIFYFMNQATLEKDRCARPELAGFVSVRRGG